MDSKLFWSLCLGTFYSLLLRAGKRRGQEGTHESLGGRKEGTARLSLLPGFPVTSYLWADLLDTKWVYVSVCVYTHAGCPGESGIGRVSTPRPLTRAPLPPSLASCVSLLPPAQGLLSP